jgi:hypothetical protein
MFRYIVETTATPFSRMAGSEARMISRVFGVRLLSNILAHSFYGTETGEALFPEA